MELYGPASPTTLTTVYTAIFDIVGEGFIDMLKLAFNNITDVLVKVTIDGETYYEFNLSDLRNKVKLSRDEQDTFLNTAKNAFSDSYPVPLFFENSLKVEVRKDTSAKRKIKGGIIRYRQRGD
jgi:phosphopantetheine adenylyltransferase